jgi:hypothetical protein
MNQFYASAFHLRHRPSDIARLQLNAAATVFNQ